jgi:hypothetical protein
MTNKRCPNPKITVVRQERLSRFIFDIDQIKNKVSQSLFRPAANLTFSTYRTTKLEDNQIWYIGETYTGTPQGKPVAGRIDLLAMDYETEGLRFDPNGVPHRRHVNVMGWNTNKPDDHAKRVELARKAKSVVK